MGIKFKNISSVALLLSSMLLFIGCGASFISKVSTVKVGDKSDVVMKKMGSRPTLIRTVMSKENEPNEIFVWSTYNMMTGASNTASFIVKDNMVIQVPFVSPSMLK